MSVPPQLHPAVAWRARSSLSPNKPGSVNDFEALFALYTASFKLYWYHLQSCILLGPLRGESPPFRNKKEQTSLIATLIFGAVGFFLAREK